MDTARPAPPLEVVPRTWALPQTPQFPEWMAAHFKYQSTAKAAAADQKKDGIVFMRQQRLVRDFLQRASPYRGLLLYHGLGSGKTCAAILASETLRLQSEGMRRRIEVMLPASIRDNYVREMRKCGRASPPPSSSPASPASPSSSSSSSSSSTVKFVNYNGLSAQKVRSEYGDPARNPFDGTVVIVDEVHNFISNVSNGRLLAIVYRRLMEAADCKILLLSGTPLVNEPHEIAYLINLVHGNIRVHEFALRAPLDPRTETQLRGCPDVIEFSETYGTGEQRQRRRHFLSVRLAPPGFVRRAPDSMDLVKADPAADPLARVMDILRSGPGVHAEHSRRVSHVELLPTDPAVFRELFVDDRTNELRNELQLANRLMGCVSYFPGHDESLYPAIRRMLFVPVKMSARQFSEYSAQRRIEIRQEIAAIRRRYRRQVDGESGAKYRPLSRASCNFAFPEEVPRPRRGGRRGGHDDGRDDVQDDDASYESALDAAAERVRQMPGRLSLKGGALDELSPKFAAIIRALLPEDRSARARTRATLSRGETARASDNPVDVSLSTSSPSASDKSSVRGTAIVYSQFRRAEGINLLAAAMDVNGFARLSVEKRGGENEYVAVVRGNGPKAASAYKARYIIYSNDDPVAASILLAIFNSQFGELPASVLRSLKEMSLPTTNTRGELVRVMLITQSGAEGISTRNVRQVHIVEPFWHANRIEQVIGRARRAYSHDDLPPSERTIDVFIYLAKMTAKQAASHVRDKGLTSDEYVLQVSRQKRQLLEKLLALMKRTAVDCGLYSATQQLSCHRPTASDRLTYHFDIARDVPKKSKIFVKRNLVAVRAPDGRLFYADPSNGKLYDYDAMRLQKKAVEVGNAVRIHGQQTREKN